MIYIAGTNHELQHNGSPSRAMSRGVEEGRVEQVRDSLKGLLKKLAKAVNAKVMAEEMCTDVLELKCALSNVREVADELGLEHRFCEPSIAKRVELGLPPYGTEDCDPETRRRFDEIRERYWLDQLRDRIDQDIIFVCGPDHVRSFPALLAREGHSSNVEVEYFGKEIYLKR